MSRKKNKITTSNVISQQHDVDPSAFLAIPVDVFKEIASLLTPGDILSLARVNKFLRVLLMQRSSSPIWKAAGRNVEMLPSCPRHLSEPEYAALVFSKECSMCGLTVMRRMDEHLSVRLCNACRSDNVIGVSQIPIELVPYIPLSPYIKNSSKSNFAYALRADVERIEDQLLKLPGDREHHAYKRWDAKRRKRVRERIRHAIALLRYNNWAEVRRDDKIEDVKIQRIQEVQTRLRALGWKSDYLVMVERNSEKTWNNLINVPKPLTDRVWERLYPKLLRLLKANRDRIHTIRRNHRRSERYALLEELLLDMRTSSSAHIELADIDWPLTNHPTPIYMPYPVPGEVLDYHVFKDLLETDRSIDATRTKFHASKDLINNAILRWRSKLEDHLVGILRDARNAQKRELSADRELVEDPPSFSTQLSEPSYDYATPRNNVLFRADSVFTLGPQCGAMFYPNGFTSLVDTLRLLPLGEHGPLEARFTASNLISSVALHYSEGASLSTALLKELGRPNAAYIELESLGKRFVCGRCPYREPQTWSTLIDHYMREYDRWLVYNSCKCHQDPSIVFNNIHDWRYLTDKPLAKLLDDNELDSHNARPVTLLEDVVECELCRSLKLDVPCGSRKFMALHLRYVHGVLQPEFGKDFIGMTHWFGGGLIEGSTDSSSASSESQE